jgi:chorismate mutase
MSARRLAGIRGATTVSADDPALVRNATRELLHELTVRNALVPDDIVSAIFTLTTDLRSEFPARAAREEGWGAVPMICAVEVPVPGALPRCIRVLVHAWLSTTDVRERHVYLGDARTLRPELGDE